MAVRGWGKAGARWGGGRMAGELWRGDLTDPTPACWEMQLWTKALEKEGGPACSTSAEQSPFPSKCP